MTSPGRPGEHTDGLIDGILQRDEQVSAVADQTSELLTFLVADIRGYTRFTQQHGDEAAAKLTAKFANVVRDMVAQFGGTVFELRGDEALCVFNSPRQCLRLAVAMQQRFVQETADDANLPMGVGIGIDAGEAVRSEDGFRGGALNLAARLCGHARAGDVLATPEVTHLAGRLDGVAYDVLDRVLLKGMTERVRPVRVVPDGEDPARQMAALLAAATPANSPPSYLSWLPRPLAARPRATLAAVLVALAGAGVLVGFTVSSSGSGRTINTLGESSVGILDAATGDIRGQVHVPGQPTALAAGFGSMWTTDTDANTVTRIDLASHRVVHTIDVGSAPSAIAVGLGSVWVANNGSGTVSRIDPSTNHPESITVGAAPRGVVVAGKSVWVTNSADGTVSRIDPDRNSVVGNVQVGYGPSGIAAGRDIWVANSASDSVTEFDARAPRNTTTFQVGTSPTAVTLIGNQVWVTNTLGGTVTRIPIDGASDPQTNAVGDEPSQVLSIGGHVWLSRQGSASITELDPASAQIVGTAHIGAVPGGIAVGRRSLWVATTIDPARHRGGVLHLFDQEVPSIDPVCGLYQDNLVAVQTVLNGSYDGLVTIARTTGGASTAVVPDLARAIPLPTNRGHAYTFLLRSGIRWSTGQPLTVDDVRRGLERWIACGGSPLSKQIVGSKRCSTKACTVSGIVVDAASNTISITLKHPNGNFIDDLATGGDFAVPASTPLAEDDTHAVPATGPYRIARFAPRKQLVLTRNPYFHQWSAVAQPAGFPDAIDYQVDPNGLHDEGKPGMRGVRAGRVDWIDARFAAQTDVLRAQFGDQLHVTPTQTVHALSLNTRVAPFNDVRVRRALAFALDRQAIADDWFVPATLTCQILPPDYSAYRPYCPYTLDRGSSRGTWLHPDVTTAERLVRESHTHGMTVTVYTQGDLRKGFSHVIDALRDLGYDAKLRVYKGGDHFSFVADSRNKVQAAFFGWVTGDATAANLLDFWRCDAIKPADPTNVNTAEFCNPAFDRLLDRARRVESTSLARATDWWAEADRFLVDKAPWIPLVTPTWVDLVSKRVSNYERSPVLGPLFDQMRLR